MTYVDLSETSLKTNIGRSEGYTFASVPESALVIVPIGNNLDSNPQNVVLGSVCHNLTLSDSKPFEAPVDFLAQNVTYDRDFSAMKETASSRRSAATATLMGTFQTTEIVSDATASYFIFDTTTGTFEKATLTETVHPFEAYLMAPVDAPDSYAVAWSDIPAGIQQIKVGTSDNIYYDLQGRRVLYPQKGLYIVNGKKVMLK